MKKALFTLFVLCFTAVCSAQEIEVTPPVQGGSSEVKLPAAVKEADGIISASTPQDAANAAVGKLTKAEGSGVKRIKVGSGNGYVAVGQGTFNADMKNPVAVRIAKRNATIRAYLDAQRQLGGFLNGTGVNAETVIKEFSDNLDTDETSLLNAQNTTQEKLQTAVNAYLAGFVLYNVQHKTNNDGSGEVNVSIIVTPKTLKGLTAYNANKVTLKQAKNAAAGIEFVKSDIKTMLKTNIIIPVGGKQVYIKPTKEFAFLGFAAEPIRVDAKWPALQKQRQKALALKTAEEKAKASLLAMLKGTPIQYDFKQTGITAEEYKQFQENPIGNITVFDDAKQQFTSRMQTNEEFRSAVSGRLPAGVQPETYYFDDNGDGTDDWAFSIAVYIPGVTAEANKLRSDIKDALNPPSPPQPKKPQKKPDELPPVKPTNDADL
jgi:hypothetical protein